MTRLERYRQRARSGELATGQELATVEPTEVFDDGPVQPHAIEAATRAEIDVLVSTAKRYPRSYQRFLQEAKAMVALDPDLASQCTYVLKEKRKKDGSPVSGPSVRLAEICALCWGNLSVAGRISDDDGKFVTAQAVAIDYEKNVRYAIELKQGVTTRDGRRYGDDMIRVACQAAISKVTRNATFKVVPLAMVSLIEAEAQRVARGDIKTLPERTERAVRYFEGKGIPESRVYESLGIAGPADMTLDLLARLNGYKVAINEGHATLEELFMPVVEVASSSTPATPANGTKSAKLVAKLADSSPPEPGSNG